MEESYTLFLVRIWDSISSV